MVGEMDFDVGHRSSHLREVMTLLAPCSLFLKEIGVKNGEGKVHNLGTGREMVVWEDVGHHPQVDKTNEVGELIVDFLKRVGLFGGAKL
mmetsp:Transcript_5987/g.9065  ORF Transcript_5987/g.9065 Transcript_5987/m.9065 type:complete len:89 (-) Transcript_5987:19-285(-)